MGLKSIVEENDTTAGRVFDLVIQGMILVSIVTFSIETLPDLRTESRAFIRKLEIVIVGIFTLEYLLRLYFADRRMRYIFSFFGVVDLVAILPFYIASGVDLRSIRILRMLRLFRLIKLARYNRAIHRLSKAFMLAREEFILFAAVTISLLYLSAVGIYYFENEAQPLVFSSVFHSLWWAVATLTTVGYGDVYPITVGGQIFTFLILMIGLGVVSVPAGIIASALSKVRMEEQDKT